MQLEHKSSNCISLITSIINKKARIIELNNETPAVVQTQMVQITAGDSIKEL